MQQRATAPATSISTRWTIEPRHPSTIPSPDADPGCEGVAVLSRRGERPTYPRMSSREFFNSSERCVNRAKTSPCD